jgi:hypothetical protein
MSSVTISGGSFCALRNSGARGRRGLLVVTAVEDADAAALGRGLHAAPEIVVVEVLG